MRECASGIFLCFCLVKFIFDERRVCTAAVIHPGARVPVATPDCPAAVQQGTAIEVKTGHTTGTAFERRLLLTRHRSPTPRRHINACHHQLVILF